MVGIVYHVVRAIAFMVWQRWKFDWVLARVYKSTSADLGHVVLRALNDNQNTWSCLQSALELTRSHTNAVSSPRLLGMRTCMTLDTRVFLEFVLRTHSKKCKFTKNGFRE